jgi:hypothetical protein
MGNFRHKALMIFASVSAYTAPALMTVCLLTDYWIYGKQTRLTQSPIIKVGDTRILNFTYHRIGLWRECVKETVDAKYICEIVKYSESEAKLEKGFKAVSCKILFLYIYIFFYLIVMNRSISTKYGLFYSCMCPFNYCHFFIYPWSL